MFTLNWIIGKQTYFFPVGLLERPVEVSGKRERKKTERLSMSGAFTPTDKKLEVPEGAGTKLGDLPRSEFMNTCLRCRHKMA
jgi:hypothetical protein